MKQLLMIDRSLSSSCRSIDTPVLNKKKDVVNFYAANKVELINLNGSKQQQQQQHKTETTKNIRRSLSPLFLNTTKFSNTTTTTTTTTTSAIKKKGSNNTHLNKLVRFPPQLSSSTLSLSSTSSSNTSSISTSNLKIFEAREIYINSTKQQQQQQQQSSAILANRPPTTTNINITNTNNYISISPALSPILYPIENFSARLMSSEHNQLIMSRSTTTSTTINASYTLVDPNKIHLFVKAGQDGRSQGACPFCQDVFLQLLIKAQTNKFNFDVITINLDNPPKEFKELSIKPPVLIHGSSGSFIDSSDQIDETDLSTKSDVSNNSNSSSGSNGTSVNAIILSDVDEIAEYLDRLYPNSKLTAAENKEAKKVCLNVFSKFSFFIRDVSSKSTNLESELEKIDNYLRENTNDENKFLNGKTMSILDCSLLPKLQHIRVAGESIKKFKIPSRFKHLWRYINNAYQTDAFQKSCPPDREIIWNWSKTFLSHKDLLQIMQEAPHKTLTIPEEIQNIL